VRVLGQPPQGVLCFSNARCAITNSLLIPFVICLKIRYHISMSISSHRFFLIFIFCVSIFLHFIAIDYPQEAVFDEVHFGKFVSGYLTHQYFFDIHPPFGKLAIAGMARVAGFKPGFDFLNIGEQYPNSQYIWLRFLPALFGSMLAPLIYLLTLRLSGSSRASRMAAFFIAFENALLAQSKFILIDSFLLFFGFASLYLFLESRIFFAQGRWRGWWVIIIAGLCAGFAISVKWTALSFLGLILLFGFFALLQKAISVWRAKRENRAQRENKSRTFLRGIISRKKDPSNVYSPPSLRARMGSSSQQAMGYSGKGGIKKDFIKAAVAFTLLLLLPAILYTSLFALHFSLLKESGPGDAYMTGRFRQSRDAGFPLSDFSANFVELNREMYRANQRITATHSYSSQWYTWPWMLRPVYYWNKDISAGDTEWYAKIYFIGNPFVWWLSTVAVIYFFARAVARLLRRLWKRFRRAHEGVSQGSMVTAVFLGVAYLFNLLPFIFIGRVMFLYHYLSALVFAIMIAAIAFTSESRPRKFFISLLIAGALLGFFAMLPLTYGIFLPASWPRSLFWLQSWV